jgi:hypothetical protein
MQAGSREREPIRVRVPENKKLLTLKYRFKLASTMITVG